MTRACALALTFLLLLFSSGGCSPDSRPKSLLRIEIKGGKPGKCHGWVALERQYGKQEFDIDVPGSVELELAPGKYTLDLIDMDVSWREHLGVYLDGRKLDRNGDLGWSMVTEGDGRGEVVVPVKKPDSTPRTRKP